MRNFIFAALSAFLFFSGCAAEEPTGVGAADNLQLMKPVFPESILLPSGFEPEGIVTGRGTTFYVGSLASGAIFKGDYRTGEGSVFIAASDRLALGLSYDSRTDYLYVAGGGTGALYIYNATTGILVAEYEVAGSGLINDVIVTKNAVYMSESFDSVYYKLALYPNGEPSAGPVEEILLTGDYDFIENPPPPGINNNGIEATPDGKYLIMNNMTDGKIYRVDAETGYAELIDLGGDLLPWGDGLVLIDHTLYVVQNIISQISEVQLSGDFLSGTIENVITSPALEVPATAALFGNSIYAVNARFTLPPGPFYVVKFSR